MALIPALVLLSTQSKIDEAINAAKPSAPSSTWSTPHFFNVGSRNGYLVKVSYEYKVYDHPSYGGQRPSPPGTPEPDPGPFKLKTSTDLLFLTPESNPRVGPISWPLAENRFAALNTDLGVGEGFHWYGRGTVDFFRSVRHAAGLEGGEDPRNLYIRALKIEDEGRWTRDTAFYALVEYKDAAIPYLREEYVLQDAKTKLQVIDALGGIRTADAAAELLSIYGMGDSESKSRVRNEACYGKYLSELKPVYADALQIEETRGPAAMAAKEFGWTEFLPEIRIQFPQSKNPLEAGQLYEAMDALGEGRLAKNVVELAHLWKAPQDRDIKVIESCPDKTYVALVGLNFLRRIGKGSTPFPEIGLKLVDSVPAEISQPLISAFKMKDRIEAVRKGGKNGE